MSRASNRPSGQGRTPHAASAEPPRLVILPGLETRSGGPVFARATGHPRRPMLTALATFAALVAQRAEGGAA